MARQLLVGTRKGLFLVGRHGREWRIERAELLGDPVTMTYAERDGTLHACQDMGHFGVKMKRSRDGGATWEERPVPQFPPKPDDVVDLDPMRSTPDPVGHEAGVGARRVAARRRALVRHDSGRPLPLARRRRQLAARRKPVEPPGPQVLGRRRRRLSRHSLDPGRPAQPRRHQTRRLVRRTLAELRRRRIVGLQRPGPARRVRAARSSLRAARAGRAPRSRNAPRRRTTSGSSITTASSAAPTAD